MAFVHIKKNKRRLGNTRSEQHENMSKAGWGAGITGEQCERSKFLEKKLGDRWLPQHIIDNAHILPPEGPPDSTSEKYRRNYDDIRWDEKEE